MHKFTTDIKFYKVANRNFDRMILHLLFPTPFSLKLHRSGRRLDNNFPGLDLLSKLDLCDSIGLVFRIESAIIPIRIIDVSDRSFGIKIDMKVGAVRHRYPIHHNFSDLVGCFWCRGMIRLGSDIALLNTKLFRQDLDNSLPPRPVSCILQHVERPICLGTLCTTHTFALVVSSTVPSRSESTLLSGSTISISAETSSSIVIPPVESI